MQWAVHVVIDSGNDWNFKMVSGKYLRRLVNINMSVLPILYNVVLHFVEVNVRSPTIYINDSQKQVFSWYHHFFELFLHVLSAPWYIWSLAFLLILLDLVESVVHVSEFVLELANDLFGLLVCAFLVFLHS